MNRKSLVIGLALSCVVILGSGKADAGKSPWGGPNATLLVAGLEGARAVPSAPMVRCTSPKAQPVGSRASIRGPGIHDVRQRSAEGDLRPSVGRSTSRSSAGPRTYWSPSSAPTSAAATLSASTGWTAQTVSPSSRILASSPAQSADHAVRSSRPDSSTRCRPTVADSWSPMGITTACCGSPSTARSPS